MKTYYITDGVLRNAQSWWHKNTDDVLEIADDQRELVIPEGVRCVGSNAFRRCTALERVVIGASVKVIDWNAFSGCTALKEIVFSEGLESISSNVFEGCTALRELILPQSVRRVSWQVFKDCTNLRSIEMQGVKTIGFSTFDGCKKLEKLLVNPECELTADVFGDGAFLVKDINGMKLSADGRIAFGLNAENDIIPENITELVIPEGVTHIVGESFGFKYANLKKVTFPTSLQSIGSAAFANTALTEIVLSEEVRVIGARAFAACSPLERVILPEGLRRIEEAAFSDCKNLSEIALPSTVTHIGRNAFWNCHSLEKLTISGGVISIGKDAFYHCDGLPSHILPESIREIVLYDDAYEFVPSGKVDGNIGKEGAVHGLLRFFSIKTIAQLIVHQKGKLLVEEISKGLAEGSGKIDLSAVAGAICAEVASVKKKAFDSAVSFYTDHVEELTAEDIRAFLAVLESKKAQKNIETLQANAEIQKKLNEESDVPAAEQHLMESSLAERAAKVFSDETIGTIRKAGRDLRANGQIPDGLVYEDGTAVSDTVFAFVVKTAEKGIEQISPIADDRLKKKEAVEVVEAFDAQAWQKALHQMFDQNMYAKNAALVTLMCAYGDEKLIAKLVPMHTKWNDWYAWGKTGKELYASFPIWVMYSPTREALVYADKKKSVAAYARIHKTTESVLRGRLLADFGFDEKGMRVFRAGDVEIEASLNPDASVQLLNRKTGKITKSFPKKGEPNDGEAFAAWKKQLATVVKSRVKALKDEFAQGNLHSPESWQEENCSNPIYSALAKGVVWGVYDEDGAYQLSFRLNDEMQKVDADGEAVEIGEGMRISVLHPVDCPWEEIRAWKKVFAMIAQPIEQLDVPVRLPDIETLADRYEGCKVNVGKLLHGMNGTEEEGTVTGGNDTVKVMVIHGYDYWGEYPVEEVYVDEKTFANKRKYSTDILQMDNLLNPFVKAEAVIAEKDMAKVREMVERGLIIRENILQMISFASASEAIEVSMYLIELSRQWGMAEDEDDLSL